MLPSRWSPFPPCAGPTGPGAGLLGVVYSLPSWHPHPVLEVALSTWQQVEPKHAHLGQVTAPLESLLAQQCAFEHSSHLELPWVVEAE